LSLLGSPVAGYACSFKQSRRPHEETDDAEDQRCAAAACQRVAHEAAPALTRFANSSPQGFVNGIKAARQQIVARTDEDRADFLRKRDFSRPESAKIIEQVLMESNRLPETVFDFVQGITRLARDKTQQDARLDMEGRAKKLLDRVG